MSFFPLELTASYYFVISVYFTIVAMLFWRSNIVKFDSHCKKQPLFLFLVFIHLLFAFDGGDYFHYYEYCLTKSFEDSTEPIYQIIASGVGYNYIIFRAIVWGGALGFFLLTAKRFGFESHKVVYLLYVMFFTLFDYARASLAMAIYFYGLSYICLPIRKSKIVSYFIGLIIIVISINFHRSMVFTSVMTLLAFVPLNKKGLFVILALFAVSAPILSVFIDSIITNLFMGSTDTAEKVALIASLNYDDWGEGGSILEWIRRYVEYSTMIIPIIYLSFKIYDSKTPSLQHKAMVRLHKVTIGIILMAFSILMVKIGNVIVFYRFLFMSIIPVTFLVFYARKQLLISDKLFKALLVLCLLCKYFGICKVLLGGGLS